MWFSVPVGCVPTAETMAAATLPPDPAGQVARMRQCVPSGSTVASASAQLPRSAVRSQFCQPTRTCANDCGGKLRFTTSRSPLGNVAKVSEVVTPKLPPPPPRNAQNRSGWSVADAVTAWPLGSTTDADVNWSQSRPACRELAPSPPPSACPATPTVGQVPVGMPRPAAANTWCMAYKPVAGVTVTRPVVAS
ncbi:Uncharacterised protein [Mycobacterium tuberculosis]|nr:Uncharacterised protein [Mycobacterium tuberculosis]CKT89518.1 Uncharacterised protein [Mycobacterium tuberculosis]